MALEIQLKAYAEAVNARLDELLPPISSRPSDLHEAMRYSCLAPGKRLRPAICLGCADAIGSADSALDAACAIEMVHCFSLIHDDLPAIDDDDLRRGLPTCHKKFGEAIAILAGDALFCLAFEVLSHMGPGIEPSRIVRTIQVLTKAAGSDGLVGGEVVDVLSEGVDVGPETLEYIHSRKTGSLMAAACEIGAVLGGGSEEQVAGMWRFGERVGLAFQIADDILNETADAARLGKAVGSDRDRAKATYTSLHGIDRARELARAAAEEAKAALTMPSPFLVELADFSITRLH